MKKLREGSTLKNKVRKERQGRPAVKNQKSKNVLKSISTVCHFKSQSLTKL